VVHFRGQQVFDRVVHHLLEGRGLRHATHALLAGCSAGGLAALLHCDQFREILEGALHPSGVHPGRRLLSMRPQPGVREQRETELPLSQRFRARKLRASGFGEAEEGSDSMGVLTTEEGPDVVAEESAPVRRQRIGASGTRGGGPSRVGWQEGASKGLR